MQKYSERLGEISDEQFQKALDTFDLGVFSRAEPISQGLFGQNIYVSSDKGDFVLRGKPHYDWQFKNEKLFVDLLHENTNVPVPYPYMLSTTKDIFGWEFIIMPRMPGKNLSDSLSEEYLNEDQRIQIAEAQGEILREAQKLTYTECGRYNLTSNAINAYEENWFDYYATQILDYLRKAADYNSNTPSQDILWVEEIIFKARGSMETFKPTFYMQDFKPGNMVVEEKNGKYRVSGLFDFMEASFGHPEADLSRMFSVYIEKNRYDLAYIFVNSYLSKNVDLEKFVIRFPLFMLHDRAIIWEYRQRKPRDWKNVFWNDDYTFRQWFSNYLNFDSTKLKKLK